jgi:amidase
VSADLLFKPALELAALIRAGELTATELVAASLDRIDALQPELHAFTHVAHESALEAAAAIGPRDQRPFAGVPIAVKDNRMVAGMPMTMGSDLFGDFVPSQDAFLVRRLRDAGFVIVGKTSLPEMGILPTTESRRFGPTRNPWDPTRTPGGSSGGSAAAVAAGMVPIAHGNDGGGSTRIPAACCGVVGLKGTRGRVSVGPVSGQSFLTVDGVLTRTVADTAAALDVLAGYEIGDATWAQPLGQGTYADAAARDPGRLRVGLALNSPLEGAEPDPAYEAAARDAAQLIESLGHEVEEIVAPWSNLDLLPDFTRVFGPHVSMLVLLGGKVAGREPLEGDVEPLTWTLWRHAERTSVLAYLSALGRLESVARSIVTSFEPYDAVLTPALAQRPVPIGEIHGCGSEPWAQYRRSGFFTPYTAIINITGQPAAAVPLYHGEDGLPTAIQLVGRPGREDVLLSLMAQLEAVLPWAERRPNLLHAEARQSYDRGVISDSL